MTRYDPQLESIAARLRAEPRSVSIVVAPVTQQESIAGALASRLARRHVDLSGHVSTTSLPDAIVTFGKGPRPGLLVELNSRRQWITDRGALVLVLSRGELYLLQKHAGDLVSIAVIHGPVSYVPRTRISLAAQRQQLAAHYRARFGRIDLRGFIRSELEDASFAVESIFQPLTGRFTGSTESNDLEVRGSAPLTELLELHTVPTLLLGTPGSGKSFFLRWYALRASAEPSFLGRTGPVPIHISLAAYSLVPGLPRLREYVIDTLLEDGLAVVDSLDETPLQSRLVFLLDGLDEAGDASVRARVASAIEDLGKDFPSASILITTRQSGLDEVELAAEEITIDPLSPPVIRELLVKWCGLYERHRVGTDDAERRGRLEGGQLAAEVLASPALRELASTPLLATIIAIVHRAGVRLPDHRAELYDHIVKILVERWNQVRSSVSRSGAPLRVGDAVRLLGPVALEMIDSDYEGAVSEDELRSMLQRSLSTGAVRGIASAEDALETFRRSLGLLVERTPSVYGFLHQTLVEFLAAHELVRTGRLEALCNDVHDVFLPKWREVILLSAGIVGQVQANDQRLEDIVQCLVSSAGHRRGKPSAAVPSLLAGLVADDPSLTPQLANRLIAEVVPKWWFSRQYGREGTIRVTSEARALGGRISRGPWSAALRSRFELGLDALEVAPLLERGKAQSFGEVVDLLADLRLEVASLFRKAILAALAQPDAIEDMPVWGLGSELLTEDDDASWRASFPIPPGMAPFFQERTFYPLWIVALVSAQPRFIWGSSKAPEFELTTSHDPERVHVVLSSPPEKGPASFTGARLFFVPSRAEPAMISALESLEVSSPERSAR